MSDPKQYTVGWICALPIEHTAARQFLDQEHDSPDVLAASDTNTYTLGEIAGHNVVIAVLPRGEYGLSSASSVATNMLHSFPNIRVGLMVGIGGGAPSPDNDVRLGDIVVSVPKDGTGGVFQFDFGKDIQDQEFRPTAHTNQPPQAALTAISNLESTYESDGHQIDESIETILDKKPRLKKRYKRPDQDSDCLYISTVVHPEGCENQSCEGLCDTQPLNIIIRAPRETQDDNPTVHYGLIASSNTLMKNALVRDSLAGTGILCFEMEAAGLMNRFPCLVVRGICDYSDTHKNKDWQGYAAMAAAAYTKDLLRVMVPRRVESEGKLADVLGNLSKTVTNIQTDTQQVHAIVLDTQQEELKRDIRRWLSPADPWTNLDKALQLRHKGTCCWLLESIFYLSWRAKPHSFLWLHGLSGCGKTVLASSIIQDLRLDIKNPLFAFFFFDFTDRDKQELPQMLRSLLNQFSRHPILHGTIQALYTDCEDGNRAPTLTQLQETLEAVLSLSIETNIIIDAIDESQSPQDVAAWLISLRGRSFPNLHLIFISRKEGVLYPTIANWIPQREVHEIKSDDVDKDIRSYVDARLYNDPVFFKWSCHRGLRSQVKAAVIDKADGMFRLAACQLDSLRDCLDRPRLMVALDDLPKTLQELYTRALTAVEKSPCSREATIMLQLLIWSDTPFSLDAMLHALSVRLDETPGFKLANRLFDLLDVTKYCSSLVSIVEAKDYFGDSEQHVRLAHSSVKEYLTSSHLLPPFRHDLAEAFSRAYIARMCISYLKACDSNSLGPKHRSTEYPLAWYCAEHWTSHASQLEDMDDSVVRSILEFYEEDSFSIYLRLQDPFSDIMYKRNLFREMHQLLTRVKLYTLEYPNEEFRLREIASTLGLFHAALMGLEVVFKRILDSEADPSGESEVWYPYALHVACFQGCDKIVKMLLDKGVRCKWALMTASSRGHVHIARSLICSGMDVHAEHQGYGNALKLAIENGHSDMIKLLVESPVQALQRLMFITSGSDFRFGIHREVSAPPGMWWNRENVFMRFNANPTLFITTKSDERSMDLLFKAGAERLKEIEINNCKHKEQLRMEQLHKEQLRVGSLMARHGYFGKEEIFSAIDNGEGHNFWWTKYRRNAMAKGVHEFDDAERAKYGFSSRRR